MRGKVLLLCGGVAAALAAALAGGGGGRAPLPSASVAGASLAEPTVPTVTDVGPGGPGSPRAPREAQAPATAAQGLGGPLAALAQAAARGDAALADLLDLDHVARVGDHYEAPVLGHPEQRAVLTLDPRLQEAAERLLQEARAPRGAIVALAPDGRVLALAGRRAAAPTGGADGTSDWRLATDVWAPAASVFKLVTAAALVGAGVGPDDKVCYHGGLRSVAASNLGDSRRDERCDSLAFGVAHSQNAILAKLAYQRLAPTALLDTAHALGVDGPLPAAALRGGAGEVTIVPERDLAYAQSAAGFAGTRLSAAGGALLAATFADRGEQPTPTLVAALVDARGAHPLAPPPRRRVVAADVARKVGRMMVGTCDFGSAAKAFGHGTLPIKVAGKTGTLNGSDPFPMQYSWFVGYAPAEQPSLIVSVVLGNAESWRLKGHTVARRLIDVALAPAAKRDRGRGSAARRDVRRAGAHVRW